MKTRKQKLAKIKKASFTAKDAKLFALEHYDLQVLIKENLLVKIERGVYQKVGQESFEYESLHSALAHLGDESCICLYSALSYHELTDEIVDKVWTYVPIGKLSHLERLKVIRKRAPMWDVGIMNENGLKITDIDRTVVDALSDKKHVPESEGMKVARLALRENKTTLKDLVKMAKKLGVYTRIKMKLTFLQDEDV